MKTGLSGVSRGRLTAGPGPVATAKTTMHAAEVLPWKIVPAARTASSRSPSASSSRMRIQAEMSTASKTTTTTTTTTTTSSSSSISDHVTFLRDVAGLDPKQPVLSSLFGVLEAKGEVRCSPHEKRKGLFPLAIPLAENPTTGSLTGLLRWPTAPEGMDAPVVTVHKHGVSLVARSIAEYVHRALVEEDWSSGGQEDRVYRMAGDLGQKLYTRGELGSSKGGSMDVYLQRKVGKFPDVCERLALGHLGRGDEISALVTGDYYASRKLFPGFGRPFVFNAELLLRLGRKLEAKDAARSALKSPWWTLGCSYKDVAKIAGWGDEQLEFMKEKVSEEGRREDLLKGKTVGQAALDQAAFLLDVAAVDGSWDEVREQLSVFYEEAEMDDVANFILRNS